MKQHPNYSTASEASLSEVAATYGAGGWMDPVIPWVRLPAQFQLVRTASASLQAAINVHASAMIGLYPMFAKWFYGHISATPTQEEKFFSNFMTPLKKVGVVRLDNMAQFESLEEYMAEFFGNALSTQNISQVKQA
jgi:hypothetical protein